MNDTMLLSLPGQGLYGYDSGTCEVERGTSVRTLVLGCRVCCEMRVTYECICKVINVAMKWSLLRSDTSRLQ